MKNNKFLILALSITLSGCDVSASASQIDQSTMCVATSDEQAMACKEGELIMARIAQSDAGLRAYNILNTVALYCNTNYPVFENAAGMICVMTHKRIDALTGLKNKATPPSATHGANKQ